MVNEIDRIGEMTYVRQKGHAEGHAEGLQEGIQVGRAEGRAERNFEIAANLKKEGLSVDLIAECTGLTPEQIVELQC